MAGNNSDTLEEIRALLHLPEDCRDEDIFIACYRQYHGCVEKLAIEYGRKSHLEYMATGIFPFHMNRLLDIAHEDLAKAS